MVQGSNESSTPGRLRRLPAHLCASIVYETVGNRVVINNMSSYRHHIYLPIMDSLQSELQRHFDDGQCGVLICAMCALYIVPLWVLHITVLRFISTQ